MLSKEAGLYYKVIGIWRRRWAENYEELCQFERGTASLGVSDRELLNRMLEILSDLPRSGHPKRITLAQEQQIIALACRKEIGNFQSVNELKTNICEYIDFYNRCLYKPMKWKFKGFTKNEQVKSIYVKT